MPEQKLLSLTEARGGPYMPLLEQVEQNVVESEDLCGDHDQDIEEEEDLCGEEDWRNEEEEDLHGEVEQRNIQESECDRIEKESWN